MGTPTNMANTKADDFTVLKVLKMLMSHLNLKVVYINKYWPSSLWNVYKAIEISSIIKKLRRGPGLLRIKTLKESRTCCLLKKPVTKPQQPSSLKGLCLGVVCHWKKRTKNNFHTELLTLAYVKYLQSKYRVNDRGK